jgi:hypothetical protein
MKTITFITAAVFLALWVAVSQATTTPGGKRALTRISSETGVPVDTLQTEKLTTGLGYGGLRNANLLANASGQSFDTIVGKFKAGEGWGEIAHDYGLNLGKLVSAAHRSSHATQHAKSVHGKRSTMHGKSATRFGNSRIISGKGGRGSAGDMVHGHGGH